jgi:hypothetical protein
MQASKGAAALWQKVCEDFSATPAHEAFLRFCHEEGELPYAASCYRGRKDALPEGDPEREAIDKRLAAIAILAMSQLDLHRSEPIKKSHVMLVLGVIAAFLTVGSLIALARAILAY